MLWIEDACAMDLKRLRECATPMRNGDRDPLRLDAEIPKVARGPVAERAVGTPGKHSSLVPPAYRERFVAHREHAVVHAVQVARRRPVPNRFAVETELPELGVRHHPMLPCREQPDRPRQPGWAVFVRL